MSKCLTCGETIEQQKGKRKRVFCSDLCRLRNWQRNNKRPIEKPKSQPEVTENDRIRRQIAAIEAELIPPERNTLLGRKVWQKEQSDKIQQLKSKLT